MPSFIQKSDLIVFSLNKWSASFERTEQIISRYARYRRVYFFEVPVIGFTEKPQYLIRETRDDVRVVESYLPSNLSIFEQKAALLELLKDLIRDEKVQTYSVWTDTPKAMPLIRSLTPAAIMYDCQMDYSQTHPELEKEIFGRADIVFTSVSSLYATKKSMHHNIYHQPDSIDYRHFFQGRSELLDPEDQAHIPHPRIGYAGVIDHTVDLNLLKNLALAKPDWHFILAGEIVNINPLDLPKLDNIHYLDQKSYVKLPIYLSNWDATFIPLQVNEQTKFTSPTLIAQSLVAGCPVVSTSLPEVVNALNSSELLKIADFPLDIISAIENALINQSVKSDWMVQVDKNYRGMSWDVTCARLAELEHDVYQLPESKMLHKIKGSILGSIYAGGFYRPREAYYRK